MALDLTCSHTLTPKRMLSICCSVGFSDVAVFALEKSIIGGSSVCNNHPPSIGFLTRLRVRGANLSLSDSRVSKRRFCFCINICFASSENPGAIKTSMNSGFNASAVSFCTGSLKQIIEPNADSESLARAA